ncbi:hypothetical protein TNCV_2168921 [Trichonephila clavipes]|nr:hypothetical protein TNCV_2168921 [Trichonephila clavipes]
MGGMRWYQSELSGLFCGARLMCAPVLIPLKISDKADHKQQALGVKFCFLLGKQQSRPLGCFSKTNDDTLGKSQVYERVSRFRSGNTSTE